MHNVVFSLVLMIMTYFLIIVTFISLRIIITIDILCHTHNYSYSQSFLTVHYLTSSVLLLLFINIQSYFISYFI